jgi:hypothetical protein
VIEETHRLHGEMINAYILAKGPEDRPWLTWEGDIKIDFKEIVWRVWIGLIWLRTGCVCRFL